MYLFLVEKGSRTGRPGPSGTQGTRSPREARSPAGSPPRTGQPPGTCAVCPAPLVGPVHHDALVVTRPQAQGPLSLLPLTGGEKGAAESEREGVVTSEVWLAAF